MNYLHDRFRTLDDLHAPDLWREIEGRALAAQPTRVRALPWVLIALILMLALGLGTGILIGSGIVRLPAQREGSATHLAYGLDGDIYVADWDGRNPVRIAHAVASDAATACGARGEGPMWSPDGRHLAYRHDCDGTVHITDPKGHTDASFPGDGWLVSWSPDSTRVATWVTLFKTIGIYGVDGSRQALLTMPPGCAEPGDFDPVWSRDGRSLVVWPCEIPIDGSAPRPFPADDPQSKEQFAYSPDGARVAYVRGESLFVAAADGSQGRVLVPTGVTMGGMGIVWSPTSDQVAFDAGPSLSAPDEIGIVDAASGKVTLLASALRTGSVNVIRFSPEGDRILFERLDANYNGTSLWSVDADGSHARLLVTGTGWGDWQPLAAGS